MTMDPGPDPADLTRRLAIIDQELAALDDRLDRLTRGRRRSVVGMVVSVVAIIVIEVTVKPAVYRWELVAALIALALAVVGVFMQDVLLRNYRAEIRELRARVG